MTSGEHHPGWPCVTLGTEILHARLFRVAIEHGASLRLDSINDNSVRRREMGTYTGVERPECIGYEVVGRVHQARNALGIVQLSWYLWPTSHTLALPLQSNRILCVLVGTSMSRYGQV